MARTRPFRTGLAVVAMGMSVLTPARLALAATCTSSFSQVKTPAVTGLLENTFFATSSDSATDTWAVGTDGQSPPLVERSDGTSWSLVATPRVALGETDLFAVAAISPSDVWVGGAGNGNALSPLIMHWTGTSWGSVGLLPFANHGSVNGLSALAPNDVWAVGYGFSNADPTHRPAIAHFDGSTWTKVPADPAVPQGSFAAVAAISPTDAWAVGSDPSGALIEHWNGSRWRAVPDPGTDPTDALAGLAAVASSDVWAVGTTGSSPVRTLTEHFDGHAWSVVPSPSPNPHGDSLSGVAALSSSDVWAVGAAGLSPRSRPLIEHWNGSSWAVAATTLPSPGSLAGITPTGTGLTAVGTFAQTFSGIARTLTASFDGLGWSQTPTPNVDDPNSSGILFGLEATSETDAWAVGFMHGLGLPVEPVAEHWNGSTWSVVPTPDIAGRSFTAVAATGPGDAWAVGYRTDPAIFAPHPLIEHFDGTAWTSTPSPNRATDSELVAVSADGPNDAWAVGGSPSPAQPLAFVLHWDGSTWSRVTVPPLSKDDLIHAVVAQSPTDVWVAGRTPTARPLVLHWDGAFWSKAAVPSPPGGGGLWAMTADPAGDLWASGVAYQPTAPNDQPLVLHESGGAWTTVAPPPLSGGGFLDAVASVSATDVWAAGFEGPSIDPLLEHWNGSGWSLVSLPSSESEISADAALSDGHVWVAGSGLHSLMQACGV